MQGQIEDTSESSYDSPSNTRNMFSSPSTTMSQVGNTTSSPPMASSPSSLSRSVSAYGSRVSRNSKPLILQEVNVTKTRQF